MFWTITTNLYLKNMKYKILWSTKHSLPHRTLDVKLGIIMYMTRLPKPRVFVAGSCPRVNILHISAGRIPRDGFWVSWSPKWPVFIDSECPVCVWRDVDGWRVEGGGLSLADLLKCLSRMLSLLRSTVVTLSLESVWSQSLYHFLGT